MPQPVQPSPAPGLQRFRAYPSEPRTSGPRQAHLLALSIPAVELLCLRLPLHHGVHSFQVGGVGHERQSDVPVCDSVDPLMVHAEVIFDISGALKVDVACDEPPPPPYPRHASLQWRWDIPGILLPGKAVLSLTHTCILPPNPAQRPSCPPGWPKKGRQVPWALAPFLEPLHITNNHPFHINDGRVGKG